MNVSVIVPVYNSESSLSLLAERINSILDGAVDEYELILVNDGSVDGSIDVIEELARRYPWIRGINLMRNSGQHNALLCGIRAARFEVIATIDDDLQHPPEELQKLFEKLEEGYDVVYGKPANERHGFLRDLASVTTKMALRATMGIDVATKVSAFRVFRTPLREAFRDYQGSFVSIDVLLTWGTTKFAAVSVHEDARPYGVSNYTFRKLVTHALNMVTGFSTLPLQVASMLGFACTAFGIAILAYVLFRFAVDGRVVPGFAFLSSMIAIFSGAQLFSLGIIGEYLARMHFRAMGRPSYTISEALPPDEN